MFWKVLLAAIVLVALAAPVSAQYAVGDTLTAAADTASYQADTIVAATGTVQLLESGGRATIVEVCCNGESTFYLYDYGSDRVVTRVYGPLYTRSWMSCRNALPPGGRARMLQITAMSGTEFIVTPGGD